MTLVPTIEHLVVALLQKDQDVLHHSERAARYASIVGQYMGLKAGQLASLQKGGVMHDLGKLAVPHSILHKPDTLNAEEWEIIRRHPEDGHARLVGRLDDASLEIVLHHHEWYDGRGYPSHIKGDDIPILARIFSIADAFDAMTADRPCRKAMPPHMACEEVLLCSSTQFDPVLVEVFSTAFDEILEAFRGDTLPVQPALAHIVEPVNFEATVPVRAA